MKSSGTKYDYVASFGRIETMLSSSDAQFSETNDIPSRESLTFSNGFYVKTAALFVDIRKSSDLPQKYSEPKMAKLYRAFISEVVAVLDGSADCDEVSIVGDGVWAVFDAHLKSQVNEVIEVAARVSSLIDGLNNRLIYYDYDALKVGIGIEWGRALMIKTGFYGSGINDIVYVGRVVNSAAKLCSRGQEQVGTYSTRPRVIAGSLIVSNLSSDLYRSFFTWNSELQAYTASISNTAMANWLAAHPAGA